MALGKTPLAVSSALVVLAVRVAPAALLMRAQVELTRDAGEKALRYGNNWVIAFDNLVWMASQ